MQTTSIRFGTIADSDPAQRKHSNKVRTTRFTLLTWAPKSLFYQFKRAANIYFLGITVLTCLPFSPKDPKTQIFTFAMMLLVTMLKDAYEDLQRARSDRELNKKQTKVLDMNENKFKTCLWEDIKLGDIVKVEKDEEIPADLLLVNSVKDIVFVSTMNLDGETNLKDRELVLNTITKSHLP
jgi:magnesium-transporting ATPase (P-type)